MLSVASIFNFFVVSDQQSSKFGNFIFSISMH